jgi:hypothetical protein
MLTRKTRFSVSPSSSPNGTLPSRFHVSVRVRNQRPCRTSMPPRAGNRTLSPDTARATPTGSPHEVGARGNGRSQRFGSSSDTGDRRGAQGAGPFGKGHAVLQRGSASRRTGTNLVSPCRGIQYFTAGRRRTAERMDGDSQPGKLLSTAVLEHYHLTLNELREVGYLTYAKRQLSPYMRACADLFSPRRRTLTQRVLDRVRKATARRSTGV